MLLICLPVFGYDSIYQAVVDLDILEVFRLPSSEWHPQRFDFGQVEAKLDLHNFFILFTIIFAFESEANWVLKCIPISQDRYWLGGMYLISGVLWSSN